MDPIKIEKSSVNQKSGNTRHFQSVDSKKKQAERLREKARTAMDNNQVEGPTFQADAPPDLAEIEFAAVGQIASKTRVEKSDSRQGRRTRNAIKCPGLIRFLLFGGVLEHINESEEYRAGQKEQKSYSWFVALRIVIWVVVLGLIGLIVARLSRGGGTSNIPVPQTNSVPQTQMALPTTRGDGVDADSDRQSINFQAKLRHLAGEQNDLFGNAKNFTRNGLMFAPSSAARARNLITGYDDVLKQDRFGADEDRLRVLIKRAALLTGLGDHDASTDALQEAESAFSKAGEPPSIKDPLNVAKFIYAVVFGDADRAIQLSDILNSPYFAVPSVAQLLMSQREYDKLVDFLGKRVDSCDDDKKIHGDKFNQMQVAKIWGWYSAALLEVDAEAGHLEKQNPELLRAAKRALVRADQAMENSLQEEDNQSMQMVEAVALRHCATQEMLGGDKQHAITDLSTARRRLSVLPPWRQTAEVKEEAGNITGLLHQLQPGKEGKE